jgi:pyruvate,water dikinase
MYVINLNEVHKDSIPEVGGKGANLGEMVNGGFPIPQGFCVTSSAYDAYIQENHFTENINKSLVSIYGVPEQGSKLSSGLMDIIKAGEISKEMHAEIQRAYEEMGNQVRVAVRSSATAEDLPEASFAGQQETYLNIRGIGEVIQAVICCFASLWTDRAIAYRKKTGFDKQKISLAIVIQEMIESDVSGVLFTINPMNNHTGEMMINASYGLGEAIVSGMVTPDTFIWDKTKSAVKQKTLGSKEISIVYGSKGGTVRKINDANLKIRYCLSVKQLKALTTIAQKIETHYGTPQDIEWAIKDNELFILQARGITTLQQRKPDDTAKTLKKQNKRERMMMNNLIEHCPTPLYPLDFVPFSAVLQGKTNTIKELGIKMTSDSLVLKDTGEFEVHRPTIKVAPRVLLIPFRIKQYQNFDENISSTKEVFREIQPRLDEIGASNRRSLSTGTLLKQLRQLMDFAEKIIYIRFRYNIYPNLIVGKSVNSRLKRLSPSVSQYDVFSGLHYKTWDMNLALSKLAKLVNQDGALRDAIINLPEDRALEEHLADIASKFPKFGSLYTQIVKEYGWKSTSTYLAFSSSSWNEDKGYFLTLLRIAMAQPAVTEESSKYEKICTQIKGSFSGQKLKKLLNDMEQMRIYHQNREESLYLLEWCYGLGRMIVKEIAKRYPELFSSGDDILYLTLNEVYLLDKGGSHKALAEKIAVRKQAVIKNRALWEEMETQSTNIGNDLLKGISGNDGKAKGRVCIIHDISEFGKLKQGDILVCKYTDPVWTPLFTIAKAVVSDTGGPLSHSAIVAREYNIPAVLGCGNATSKLKDNDEILVDGNKGTVTILH